MKCKLKLLAAAVTLAISAQAGAASLIDPTTGYGSLVLNVWDNTNRYVRNLGQISDWLTNNENGTVTLKPFASSSHQWGQGATSPLFDTLFGSPSGTVRWNVMAAFTDQNNFQYDGIATSGVGVNFSNGGI